MASKGKYNNFETETSDESIVNNDHDTNNQAMLHCPKTRRVSVLALVFVVLGLIAVACTFAGGTQGSISTEGVTNLLSVQGPGYFSLNGDCPPSTVIMDADDCQAAAVHLDLWHRWRGGRPDRAKLSVDYVPAGCWTRKAGDKCYTSNNCELSINTKTSGKNNGNYRAICKSPNAAAAVGDQGTGKCPAGSIEIRIKTRCESALSVLKIPVKAVSDGQPCYMDGAGNGFANGGQGAKASFVCELTPLKVESLKGAMVQHFSDLDVNKDQCISKAEFDALLPFKVLKTCPPVPAQGAYVKVEKVYSYGMVTFDAKFNKQNADGTWNVKVYYEKQYVSGTIPYGKTQDLECSVVSIPKQEGYRMFNYKAAYKLDQSVLLKPGDQMIWLSKSIPNNVRYVYFTRLATADDKCQGCLFFTDHMLSYSKSTKGTLFEAPYGLIPVIGHKYWYPSCSGCTNKWWDAKDTLAVFKG
jgi:hypothetical protein